MQFWTRQWRAKLDGPFDRVRCCAFHAVGESTPLTVIFCAGLIMERRNSYHRSIYAPTVASRIADARNKRETLLLAETRKGLFGKKDRTIRTFYREKAKENNFLRNIRRRSSGMLIANEHYGHGETGTDEKISFTRRNAMTDKKARRQSLQVYETGEMHERIQEFLAQGLPGRQSTVEQDGHFKEKSIIKNEFVQKSVDVLGTARYEDESKRIEASTLIPFKVRSRTSGVCFSHSHCQHLHLPPINMPDLRRKCSTAEYRRNSFGNFSKRRCRKLSTPTVAGRLSLEHQTRMTSIPLINTQREAINETSREV